MVTYAIQRPTRHNQNTVMTIFYLPQKHSSEILLFENLRFFKKWKHIENIQATWTNSLSLIPCLLVPTIH